MADECEHDYGPEVADEYTYIVYYRKKCRKCGDVVQREEKK